MRDFRLAIPVSHTTVLYVLRTVIKCISMLGSCFYYSSYFWEYSLRYFFYYINYFSFFSVCKLLRTFASCICYFFSAKHCICYIPFANKSLNHISFNKTTSSNNFSYFRIEFSLLIEIQYNLSAIVLSSISIFLLLFLFVLFHYSGFSFFLRDTVSNFEEMMISLDAGISRDLTGQHWKCLGRIQAITNFSCEPILLIRWKRTSMDILFSFIVTYIYFIVLKPYNGQLHFIKN